MSRELTQKDVFDGALFRKIGWPSIIGRVEFFPHTLDAKTAHTITYKNVIDCRDYLVLSAWEPITITPENLKEYFGIMPGVEFPVKDGWYSLQFFFRKGNIEALYMKTKPGANPIPIQIPESIHELQRLVLALTGYQLEGGPK